MSSENIVTLSTVIHTTLEKSRKNLMMVALRNNAFYSWAMANNQVIYEDGGREISNPLIVRGNTNTAWSSYYDTLPVNQTNEFETVRYKFSRFNGSLIVSQQEKDENTGTSQIANLVAGKLQALKESIANIFSTSLYGIGVGTAINGLGLIIPDDPTVGTLGGINRATESYWRTSAYNFAGQLNSTTIEEALDDVILDLTLRKSRPKLILMGRDLFRMYKAAVRDKLTAPLATLQNGQRVVDLGFEVLTHAGITIMYDEDCPRNKVYMINSDYMKMHVFKHVNMRQTTLTSPINQEISGERITWQGQLCSWDQYRRHAVLIN